MVDWLAAVLAIFGVFSVVVAVHEIGHFLAARVVGVTVPVVSLGIGPLIWQRRWGSTQYRVSLLPVGGFVQLASRTAGDVSPGTMQDVVQDAVQDAARSAQQNATYVIEDAPLVGRLFILSAGVAMNILCGVLIFASLASMYRHPVRRTTTFGGVRTGGEIQATSFPIALGDTIRSVDGHRVDSWDDITNRITTGVGSQVAFQTQHGTVAIDLVRLGVSRFLLASIMEPYISPVVASVVTLNNEHVESDTEGDTGIQRGDSILAVDGHVTRSWYEVKRWIRIGRHQITLAIVRGGRHQTITVQSDSVSQPPLPGMDLSDGAATLLGRSKISPRPTITWVAVSPLQTLYLGGRATVRLIRLVVPFFGRLLTGHIALSEVEGPIAIAQQSARAAHHGVAAVLGLIASISIDVALMNLLFPLPLLDGGQILLVLLEAVRGSALSPRVNGWLMRGGLVIVVVLSCIIMIHDVFHILT